MAFENLLGRVTDLAQSGAAKAREVTEIGKLKVNNAAEEDAIRKAYIEIGKLYFAQHGDAPEAGFAPFCEKIRVSREKIEANKQKIADIKAANNIKDDEVDEVVEVVAEDVSAEAALAEENPVQP